jgi:hypothetical protein
MYRTDSPCNSIRFPWQTEKKLVVSFPPLTEDTEYGIIRMEACVKAFKAVYGISDHTFNKAFHEAMINITHDDDNNAGGMFDDDSQSESSRFYMVPSVGCHNLKKFLTT